MCISIVHERKVSLKATQARSPAYIEHVAVMRAKTRTILLHSLELIFVESSPPLFRISSFIEDANRRSCTELILSQCGIEYSLNTLGVLNSGELFDA